jgi:transcriptional regulator of acetoin/glycerol metabolism
MRTDVGAPVDRCVRRMDARGGPVLADRHRSVPGQADPLVVRGGRFGILETHHGDGDESLPLGDELGKDVLFDDLAGSSAALRAVLSHVAKVAPTDSTVLVTGETGTGKSSSRARSTEHRGARRAPSSV